MGNNGKNTKIVNCILLVTGLVFLIGGPLIVWLIIKDTQFINLFVLSGLGLILLAQIDRFKEFTVGPVSAKLDKKIEEANVTLEQLQKIAADISSVALTQMMASSFMGNISFKDKLELHDKIIESLKEIGCDPHSIKESEHLWNKGIRLIYHRGFTTLIRREELGTSRISKDPKREKIAQKCQDLQIFENWEAPTPQRMELFLKQNSLDEDQINGLLEEYKYFVENNEIRNKELFLKI